MADYSSHFERSSNSTIVARGTPFGRGGIGIIRVSGPLVSRVAQSILNRLPKPRQATHAIFQNMDGLALDEGIALFFPKPHSFTGEDVLELQGHGSPIVLDLILETILKIHPALRIARPGEFSERAFLNGKIDLTQAEAIADLIEASNREAAKSAMRSLQGAFSKKIHELLEPLITLRTLVEAALDFPEEDIDFLKHENVGGKLEELLLNCENCFCATRQGVLLSEGITLVITGRPNAGKSSLLNALTGTDTAIVTPIPGTTRDVLKEQIQMEGIPLHIMDTAGIRENPDSIEQEGIKRAWREIEKADFILGVVDGTLTHSHDLFEIDRAFAENLASLEKLILIRNKSDLTGEPSRLHHTEKYPVISLSAKTGMGIDVLKQFLKEQCGFRQTEEGSFLARRRHLDALDKAKTAIQKAKACWQNQMGAEFIAEELREAQRFLSEITGAFTTEDLLSRIFSTFCVGK